MNLFTTTVGILSIAFGEALAIWCEIMACKHPNRTLEMLWWITLAGIPLIYGYRLAFTGTGNIWIVSAVSIISILFAEPFVTWAVFKETPTLGPILGLVFGAVGLACTFFIK